MKCSGSCWYNLNFQCSHRRCSFLSIKFDNIDGGSLYLQCVQCKYTRIGSSFITTLTRDNFPRDIITFSRKSVSSISLSFMWGLKMLERGVSPSLLMNSTTLLSQAVVVVSDAKGRDASSSVIKIALTSQVTSPWLLAVVVVADAVNGTSSSLSSLTSASSSLILKGPIKVLKCDPTPGLKH